MDLSGTPSQGGGSPLVSVRELSKSFGPNKVLRDVSLDIRAGEVLVLLGPNGAGKSTLLNIIGGTLAPTSGSLFLDGTPVIVPHYGGGVARGFGIQRVFQELSTFANLTVAENLSLTSTRDASLSRAERLRRARDRMQAFPGNTISVGSEMARLSVAERQMVEIARAMTEPGTRLVVLDEPTSALSSEEAEQLSDLVRRKAAEGLAIIYVTHKLEEALRLADRIVVLRDGRLHWDGAGRSLTHDQLLMLLGAVSAGDTPPAASAVDHSGEDLLAVVRLETAILHDLSIHVARGELVGIAGLEGAGQRELLQAIFEARGRERAGIRSASDIAYVSGDRKREGLLPLWSVEDNVAISAVPRFATLGFVDFRGVRDIALSWLSELGLAHRSSSPITSLSGGNQQRALVGRALASDAPLLLLDDPTRGVDVNAKAAIYELLGSLKAKGRSAILYSTEVAEFRICDRVYVMARGHVVSEFLGTEATEARIVEASFLNPRSAGSSAGSGSVERSSSHGGESLSWSELMGLRALPAALLMVAMFGLAFWLRPNAFSAFGIELLLQATIPLAFAVLAQMLFLLGGDIDLGLGFAIGFANALAATYLVDSPLLGALGLCGIVAGYVLLAIVVELLGVSSVVATLSASFVWLGLGLMVRETPGGHAPEWLAATVQVKLWVLPLPVAVLIGAALLGLWLCQRWSYSIRLRALGHNRRTYVALGYSALAGRMTIYALAGLFAVVAGLVITGTTGAGNVNVAASFTLSTVAAVVVGGASFAGGLVSPVGAVMAIVGISLITTNLVFLGVSSEYATAIGGIVLILSLSMKTFMGQKA